MDLRQLRFLIAVADAGGIRKAARDLQIAQPPVSHALRQLEAELGTELLARGPFGIALTDEGEELVRRGRRILQDLDDAREAIRAQAQAQATVRVGLTSGFLAAGNLTAPIIEGFRTNHPELCVSLHPMTFNQTDALVNRDVDVALLRGPIDHRDLEFFPLASESRRLLVYAGGPFGEAESLTIDDIADVPTVPMEGPTDWRAYWQLDAERGRSNTHPDLRPAVSVEAIQYLVVTHGVVLTGSASVEALVPNPLVRLIPMDGIGPSHIYVARRRDDRRRSIRAFIDEAVETASRHSP